MFIASADRIDAVVVVAWNKTKKMGCDVSRQTRMLSTMNFSWVMSTSRFQTLG